MSNEKHSWQYFTWLILLVLNNFITNRLITKSTTDKKSRCWQNFILLISARAVWERGISMSVSLVSVCLYVCPRAYLRNYSSSVHQFLRKITYGHGSVLLRRRCDMLCTSGLRHRRSIYRESVRWMIDIKVVETRNQLRQYRWQVSAVTDGPARRVVSRASCCRQWWTLSVTDLPSCELKRKQDKFILRNIFTVNGFCQFRNKL